MTAKRSGDPLERMVDAYEAMLHRVHEAVEATEEKTVPGLRRALSQARDKAVELNELTREEAERLAGYLERDLTDLSRFVADTGQDFRDWFRFDLKLVEQRVLDLFLGVADHTSLALRELAERARQASRYRAGEITGPGTLICTYCGEVMHFPHVSRIPPCPGCHGQEFRRASAADSAANAADQGDVDGD